MEYLARSKVHIRKFLKLKKQQEKVRGDKFKMDAVIDLSSKSLTAYQHRVLARGFKFRPTANRLPVKEIVVETEKMIVSLKMEASMAMVLRHTVLLELCRMEKMEKKKKTKSNLSKAEWAAIKQLRDDPEIIIIPADKGDKSIRLNYGLTDEEKDNLVDIQDFGPSILENQSYLQKMKE